MALSRSQKSDKVKKLAGELETSTSAIIGTFTGLTAAKDFDLRKTVRAAGGSYSYGSGPHVGSEFRVTIEYDAMIERVLDGLADHLEQHLDLAALLAAARPPRLTRAA